jgi:CubicO group peptidase (beta-lactamase class C family)
LPVGLQNKRVKNMQVFDRIAIVVALSVLASAGTSVSAAAQQAEWPTQGWRRSSPEAQGMDSEVLAEAFDEIRRRHIAIHSLTVVRNGHLVLDAYFWPFQDHLLHDMASVTKSVTSTLVGVAIGQGKVKGVTQPVLDVLGTPATANLDSRKTRLTVEHLLTMTSGLDCHPDQGEITLAQMRRSPDWIGFMLDLPMVAEPGGVHEYCSGGMHLLSGIITKATGMSALDFARRTLFTPMGIGDAAWPSDAQGISLGWGDLHLQPRDMAKIGYLWLRGGQWENRQLVPADWMQAAVQVHSHPGSNAGPGYGYGLWVYPDRSPPIFEGLGRGGQRISIVPAKDLVVVFTGGEFEPGDIGQFIGRAIKSDRTLPENPAGAARLATAVRAATDPPAARPVTAAPATAKVISGRTYALDANPFDLRSFSLTFSGGTTAQLQLELVDRLDRARPVGLDGVPRVSPDGRFGLPVAVSGAWESDSTFILDYDEVGNINHRRFRLTFVDEGTCVELTDRSEPLATVRYRGRAGTRH